jgi:hypothetical protein
MREQRHRKDEVFAVRIANDEWRLNLDASSVLRTVNRASVRGKPEGKSVRREMGFAVFHHFRVNINTQIAPPEIVIVQRGG